MNIQGIPCCSAAAISGTETESKGLRAALLSYQESRPVSQKVSGIGNDEAAYPADKVQADRAIWQAANAPVKEKSIYDFSPSDLEEIMADLTRELDTLNTAGMSKGEIYNLIESVYVEHLGKDFLEPRNVTVMGYTKWPLNTYFVSYQFDKELSKYGIHMGDTETIIEARGYEGLSKDEMRSAVRSQYPETMTLRDCINMGWELGRLGLEEINYGAIVTDRITTIFWINSPHDGSEEGREKLALEAQKVLDAMLDLPADFETIKSTYNAHVRNDYLNTMSKNLDTFFAELLPWFGCDRLYSQEMLDKIFELLKEIRDNTDIFRFVEYSGADGNDK